MEQFKLVFSGPVGVGKTTAVSTLCHGKLLTTEALASDITKSRKTHTTVAFDYGMLDLEGNARLHVYGTPGQERFDFMWEILSEGGLGLILMLDNSRPAPFNDLHFFINSFRQFIDETALVLGITRTQEYPLPSLLDYRHELEKMGVAKCPIFEVDARIRDHVLFMVQALLYQISPDLAK